MNHCDLQKSVVTACEEMRRSVFISDRKDTVVCPKPRRVGLLTNHPIRHLRWHMSHQVEVCDSQAGQELLEIILMKDCGEEQLAARVGSPPPIFCGSPPSRAANPLTQDARFRDEMFSTFSPLPTPSSPSSPARKGGCARMKFGLKPAAVRVEGFECHLNRDRNSSITAVA